MVGSWRTSTAFRVLLLFSSVLSTYAANGGTWEKICRNHPYAFKENTGIVKPFNPKDESSYDSAAKCTLTFDYDDGAERAEQFCESRFYDSLQTADYNEASRQVTCTYEAFDYCDNEDIAILGKCYRLKTEPKSLKDAKKTCEQDKMTFATFEDQPALEWLLILHDPNPKEIVHDVWIDANIKKFDKNDREEQESTSKETSSVLRFRYGATGSPGKYRAVDPNEKHAYYCVAPSKRYMAAFKHFCDTVREQFKIPAAYHKATCFMLSTSVYVPKFSRGSKKISNEYYHHQCNYVEGMQTYATAPTSLMKFEGIKKATLSMNNPPIGQAPRILVPGHNTETATTLNHMCQRQDRRSWTKFFYIGSDMKEYDVHSSGWDGNSWKKECADLHRDIIALAPHSGTKIGGSRWPEGDDRHFAAYDYPRFFRGPIVCAAGFHESDIFSTKCPHGWLGMARDDGTMLCHKVVEGVYEADKDDVIQKCKQEGGSYLSPVDSAIEQQRFHKLIKEAFKRQGNSNQYGSAFLGMHAQPWGYDFVNDYDGSPVYYSNWAPGEPSNLGGFELCAATVINPYSGQWNDQYCSYADGKYKHPPQYKIRAALCAKPADP